MRPRVSIPACTRGTHALARTHTQDLWPKTLGASRQQAARVSLAVKIAAAWQLQAPGRPGQADPRCPVPAPDVGPHGASALLAVGVNPTDWWRRPFNLLVSTRLTRLRSPPRTPPPAPPPALPLWPPSQPPAPPPPPLSCAWLCSPAPHPPPCPAAARTAVPCGSRARFQAGSVASAALPTPPLRSPRAERLAGGAPGRCSGAVLRGALCAAPRRSSRARGPCLLTQMPRHPGPLPQTPPQLGPPQDPPLHPRASAPSSLVP